MSQVYSIPVDLTTTTANAAASIYNDAFDALLTLHSGASEPATTTAYMLWTDTTTGKLKMRNAADYAWVILVPDITAAAGGLVEASAGAFNTASPTADTAATLSTNLIRKNEADAAVFTCMADYVAGAAGTDTSGYVFYAPAACTVGSVYVISDTATADSPGNLWTIDCYNVTDSNNLASSPINTNSNPIVVNTALSLAVNQNLALTAGDVLQIRFTESGTATSLNTAEIKIAVNYTKSF